MLHIINQFPIDPSTFSRTRIGDTVLFTDNAILAIKKCSINQHKALIKALKHLNSCVCRKDLIDKGVSSNEILNKVSIIDDQDLQTITESCTVIRSCN